MCPPIPDFSIQHPSFPCSLLHCISCCNCNQEGWKPRFCVDYRTLNKVMKPDRWPLPKIKEILEDLCGSSYFTSLDIFSGYWQIQLDEQCKENTTFTSRFGTFQFEVMPLGLMNAPATFQRMMDSILRTIPFARLYLDDVVIFSKHLKGHLNHAQAVLHILKRHGLKIKASECAFAQP